jgi:hypothetical protein
LENQIRESIIDKKMQSEDYQRMLKTNHKKQLAQEKAFRDTREGQKYFRRQERGQQRLLAK